MFKVNNIDTRTTPDVVLVSLLLTLNIFHTLSSVPIVNFEHVNAYWAYCLAPFLAEIVQSEAISITVIELTVLERSEKRSKFKENATSFWMLLIGGLLVLHYNNKLFMGETPLKMMVPSG